MSKLSVSLRISKTSAETFTKAYNFLQLVAFLLLFISPAGMIVSR